MSEHVKHLIDKAESFKMRPGVIEVHGIYYISCNIGYSFPCAIPSEGKGHREQIKAYKKSFLAYSFSKCNELVIVNLVALKFYFKWMVK